VKTAGEATGNHRGKFVIRETETEYTAAPFCGVDMPSRPLTWSSPITPRHDMFKMS